jgi:predicted ArsR family transcriptional regulator
MHSTKAEILALLKRNDGSSVDELATALNLAPMTVRQHLTTLERDALVHADEVRRPTGRPHYRYRLTGDGHRSVCDGRDRLLALLIDRLGEDGDRVEHAATALDRRRRIFELAASSLAERHQPDLRSTSGPAQMDRLIHLLKTYGGFPDWHEDAGVYELRDFACVYRETVAADGPCGWHEPLLRGLLACAVTPVAAMDGCAQCCRYLIEPAPAEARNGR